MKWKPWVWILVGIVIGVPLLFALVGILAGFFFPAVSGARQKAEHAHAESTAYHLKNAIATFHTEYRDYPLTSPSGDFTTDSGHTLMDILLGAAPHKVPGGRNPRGIAFYADKEAKPMAGGRFRKGITYHPATGTGELWDPWGNLYRVRLDTDHNRRVENPEVPATSAFLPETILVWSAGPDGDFDTWADNIKSW